MNEELMERFARENDYGDWPYPKEVVCIYNKLHSFFIGHRYYDTSPLNTDNYDFVCTREQYEDYIKQRNNGLSPNTLYEVLQLLETLAEQSNYDINITPTGTVIYSEAGDQIQGTPEQLCKILEAQIHLRNLIKGVTSE